MLVHFNSLLTVLVTVSSISLCLRATVFMLKQDNVDTNTESVQCSSTDYSICPYKYNQ